MLTSFYQRIGNPHTETAFLTSRSPTFHAHQIKIPVLIAMGGNDQRAVHADMERIVHTMQHTGVPCDYLLFPDEGHTFTKPKNRLTFYAQTERFLDRYLGGQYEAEIPSLDQ